MSRVRGRNTTPELAVRRVVHSLGYRYRLHRVDLPGKPDLVFSSRRKIILVHGCFWHRHDGCTKSTAPKTNVEFWQEKFRNNVDRDQRVIASLRELGWNVLVVWQCETAEIERLTEIIKGFLQ
jgi:DNA mismatch endonuclease (patch repair protein)